MVPAGGGALAHEHARSRSGFEHVIDALDLERRTFLVRARADFVRDALAAARADVGV